MTQRQNSQKLSDSEFKDLSKLIFHHSGIVISKDKRTLLESRLSKRARALQILNLESYYNFLLSNKQDELLHLLDVVTTNVTSFFREDSHFDVLTEKLLKPKMLQIEKGSTKNELSIWSAGCSTGEEAISIVIAILESVNIGSLKIKILATDLSIECLKQAKKSEYAKHHFSKFSERILEKYFVEHEHYYKAKPILTSKITWRQFNLKSNFQFENKFDAIFCRNVMIYFDQDFRDSLVEQFRKNLRPNGMLFVGLSESLNRQKLKLKYHSPSVYINKEN